MNKNDELNKYKKQLEIMNEKYNIANKWIYILNGDITLTQGLIKKGFNQMVIYGASEFAVRLIECCHKEKFAIKAIVDKKIKCEGGFYRGIPLITIHDLGKMDLLKVCVVITSVGFFDEIDSELNKRHIKNVISLRDLIEWAM
jgi:hypothetical protein